MEAASLRRLARTNFDRLRSTSVVRVEEIDAQCVVVDDGEALVITVLDPRFEAFARSLVRILSIFGRLHGDVVLAALPGRTPENELTALGRASACSGFVAWRLNGSELVRMSNDGVSFVAGRKLSTEDVPLDLVDHRDVLVCGFHDGGSIEYRGLRVAQFDFDGFVEVGVSERDRQSRVLGFGEAYAREIELTRCLDEVRLRRRAESNHPLAAVSKGRWMRHALLHSSSPASLSAVEVGSVKDIRERSFAIGDDGEYLAAFFGGFEPASVLESLVVLSDLREYGQLRSQSALRWYVQERDVFPIWNTWAESLDARVEVRVMPRDWQSFQEDTESC
jgi:hypothetical protein